MKITESLDLINQSEQVLGQQFYAELSRRFPEAAKLFDGVNMERQGALFTMQLMIIVAYYQHKTPTPGMYLQVLGTRHRHRGVPVEMYPKFCDVLLDVLGVFLEDNWDDSLAEEWRKAIHDAVEKMLEGYDRRYHV